MYADILPIDCYKLELKLIHFEENSDTKEKVSGKQHPKFYWITSIQMIVHSFMILVKYQYSSFMNKHIKSKSTM